MKHQTNWELVGKTPLIYLKTLSELTECEIFAKAEYLNPAGSIKDRAAKMIIQDAEQSGRLKPGMTIYEGTAGNTGIGLAALGIPRGYRVVITMPSNQAPEKFKILKALGAEVQAVPPVPFSNPNHFYHFAKTLSEQDPFGFWANQFENKSNYKAHFETTGPEIYEQMEHDIDVFVAASGTGGTLGGVTHFLKSKSQSIKTVLADPFGSGLFEYILHGELKSEGSSVTEGIGIMRITANFAEAQIDDAIRISDHEMISMLYYLARHESLFVGTSAALNVMAAYRIARERKGQRIVTILCDHGTRYQDRILSDEWLKEKSLVVSDLKELSF